MNTADFTTVPVESLTMGDRLPFDPDGNLITDPDKLSDAVTWKTVDDRWAPTGLTEQLVFDDGTEVDVPRTATVLVRTPDEQPERRETFYGIATGSGVEEVGTCRGEAVVANGDRDEPGCVVFREVRHYAGGRVVEGGWRH